MACVKWNLFTSVSTTTLYTLKEWSTSASNRKNYG